MLGISAGKGGENFGYQWFMARFDSFLYIDRVVVHDECRRLGLAIEFYHEAVHWCRARGIEHIVCQIHDRPPNPVAHALHDKLGFTAIESVMLPSRNIVTMVQRSTAIDTP
ncbi:MAG: GNAT family N-acetyltransferase [Gammaproteobacteria bacterium]|nr:GNAT family N-acetyltransferase [Gammaproteobacteria bacterium]